MTLEESLRAIQWNNNVENLISDKKSTNALESGCKLVSVWNYELGFQFHDNPALCFLQEMKASLFYVPACFAAGLYKPAASSMRAAVENALYFTYFCDHEVELKTLLRENSFYISKDRIIEYHVCHTPEFANKQNILGFQTELTAWYSEISAIIHGQIPGIWSSRSLSATEHNEELLGLALKEFLRAVNVINYAFLITVAEEVWDGMSTLSRQFLLRGMSGNRKNLLNRALI